MSGSMIWVRGRYVYQDDFTAEVETWRFLKRCKQEGRITAGEFMDIARQIDVANRSAPGEVLRYDDFVRMACEETGWPEDDVRRCLALHLKDSELTPAHVEVYINYPARTQRELSKLLGLNLNTVFRMLKQVRGAWSNCLRFDVVTLSGVPCLNRMESLSASNRNDEEYNRSDEIDTVPICGGFSDIPYDGED